MAELSAYLFACLCMCTYLQQYPHLVISGLALSALFIFNTIQSGIKWVGVTCHLNYSAVEHQFTAFGCAEVNLALPIKKVRLLWHCRYCALLGIEGDTDEPVPPPFNGKQWIYAAETTALDYSHLLRVLQS